MKYSPLMHFLSRNQSRILVIFGIAGSITAAAMAVDATPKAIQLMEQDKKKAEENNETYTTINKVESVWKCYAPAAIVELLAIMCIIFSETKNEKRNAALATAYAIAENRLQEYQRKVVESIGEKKESSIRDEIAKDRIEAAPVIRNDIIFTGKGDTLCYDAISGRYFKSDIDAIRKAENAFNRSLLDETFMSLNELYYELGLDGIKVGEYLGWNCNDGLVSLTFSSQLTRDETPCLVIDYSPAPKYDYQRF